MKGACGQRTSNLYTQQVDTVSEDKASIGTYGWALEWNRSHMIREGIRKYVLKERKIEADFVKFEVTKFKVTMMMMVMINRTKTETNKIVRNVY